MSCACFHKVASLYDMFIELGAYGKDFRKRISTESEVPGWPSPRHPRQLRQRCAPHAWTWVRTPPSSESRRSPPPRGVSRCRTHNPETRGPSVRPPVSGDPKHGETLKNNLENRKGSSLPLVSTWRLTWDEGTEQVGPGTRDVLPSLEEEGDSHTHSKPRGHGGHGTWRNQPGPVHPVKPQVCTPA